MSTLKYLTFALIMSSLFLGSCKQGESGKQASETDSFQFVSEQFADLKILRYQIPGFDDLSLKQKELLYYLSQAALAGRDILWDQKGEHNLQIRSILENIYETYKGDRNTEEFKAFTIYLKRIWFSNGIHHHYSTDKIMPAFSQDYFKKLVASSDKTTFRLPEGKTLDQVLEIIEPVMFDPNIMAKGIWQDPSKDLLTNSANNLYSGVTEKEAHAFYKKMKKEDDPEPVSYGLNTRLVKENGKLVEKVYKVDGLYGTAINQIIYWLEKAKAVAESDLQAKTIEKLVSYYKTGDLKTFDEYNILWVSDTVSQVDFVNGFIEVYEDPIGIKATWESVVNFKNIEATKRTEVLSSNAQWFEDNSPVDPKFKKEKVKGVSAKVITVAQLGGDCHPATPIGINLPNADWIRREHGSKSVTIENITYAYDQAAQKSGMLEEFAADEEEIELARKYSFISGNLHTDLHECLGHGSGKMLPGVSSEALKNYHSTIEETRADLFALYYMFDQKMVDLDLLPSPDAAKAEYDAYIKNGLMTQLVRIEKGKNIEESHMRNRQLIAKWCYEKGKAENVIEFFKKEDKTYIRINDYQKLRNLLGQLLAEVQRIKSEGDFAAAKELVENYAVKVDQNLLAEVHERYKKLNLAPYSGFLNPVLIPVFENGKITDVKIEYPDNFANQMLNYSKNHSFLPVQN